MQISYWVEHFERNSTNRTEPDWKAPMHLQGAALAKLTRSLEQFQLGDGGGPAYLVGWDKDVLLEKSPEFKTLVDLWFKEEAEHSRLLGDALIRFAEKKSIPTGALNCSANSGKSWAFNSSCMRFF